MAIWRGGMGMLAATALLGAGVPAMASRGAPAASRSAAPTSDTAEDEDADTDTSAPMSGEDLTNAQVVALNRTRLGDPALAQMVRVCKPHFDISTRALLALRAAGVSSRVIAAMIKVQAKADGTREDNDSPDPHQPHGAGLYLLAGWLEAPRMFALAPQTTTRTTSGSILGYAFSGGIVSVGYKAMLPGAHAPVIAEGARPVFYVFGAKAGNAWGPVPAPEEVSLVRFSQGAHGREVRIGSFNIHGASTGIRDADRIAFRIRQLGQGAIELRPEEDLAPGEYGFVQTAAGVGIGAARASTSSARVFAFAVGPHGSQPAQLPQPGTSVQRGPGMDRLNVRAGRRTAAVSGMEGGAGNTGQQSNASQPGNTGQPANARKSGQPASGAEWGDSGWAY
ncbi:MAG TPA: hypothetical protein VFF98_13105 [Novosphingobium sp.]|nr:hypothetical protein [Novosphingobium sp.]